MPCHSAASMIACPNDGAITGTEMKIIMASDITLAMRRPLIAFSSQPIARQMRGLLAATIFVMILMAFSLHPPPQAIQESTLAPYVLDASRLFSKAAPKELTEGFQNSYEKLKRGI